MAYSGQIKQKHSTLKFGRVKVSLIFLAVALCVSAVYAFVNREPALPSIPSKYSNSILVALNKSGENRRELVRALAGIRRDRLPAMCDMISRMPNYDLVHMTSSMAIDHVNCTFDVLPKVKWKTPATNSQIFLDYVLPHRVYCEGLENSRGKISALVLPAVQKCNTPAEAVDTVMGFSDNPAIVKQMIGNTFPYDYPAFAGWQHGFKVNFFNCRARALLFVAMLRSIGIPACETDRLATASLGTNHAYILWYDTAAATWHIHGPDGGCDDRAILKEYGPQGEMMVYSVPPYMTADYLGKHQFDKLIPIQNLMPLTIPRGTLIVKAKIGGAPAKDAVVGVYIWNFRTQNWCNVVIGKTNQLGEAEFSLGYNEKIRPYMISVSKGKQNGLGYVRLSPANEEATVLNISLTSDLAGYADTTLKVRAREANPGYIPER